MLLLALFISQLLYRNRPFAFLASTYKVNACVLFIQPIAIAIHLTNKAIKKKIGLSQKLLAKKLSAVRFCKKIEKKAMRYANIF